MKKLKAFLGGSYIPEEYWDEWIGNRKTKVSEQELVFPEEAVARLIQDYMENKEGAFFLYDQNGRPKKTIDGKGFNHSNYFTDTYWYWDHLLAGHLLYDNTGIPKEFFDYLQALNFKPPLTKDEDALSYSYLDCLFENNLIYSYTLVWNPKAMAYEWYYKPA